MIWGLGRFRRCYVDELRGCRYVLEHPRDGSACDSMSKHVDYFCNIFRGQRTRSHRLSSPHAICRDKLLQTTSGQVRDTLHSAFTDKCPSEAQDMLRAAFTDKCSGNARDMLRSAHTLETRETCYARRLPTNAMATRETRHVRPPPRPMTEPRNMQRQTERWPAHAARSGVIILRQGGWRSRPAQGVDTLSKKTNVSASSFILLIRFVE